jgi:hypothetical protein
MEGGRSMIGALNGAASGRGHEAGRPGASLTNIKCKIKTMSVVSRDEKISLTIEFCLFG